MLKYALLSFFITLNLFLVSFLANINTYAQTTVTVTAGVGDTIVTLSGKTSPNSQVTFLRSGSVIGTTVSDDEGDFYKQFTSQAHLFEIQTISIYSTDTEGINTSTVSYTINVPPHAETHLANIVLPPTINLSTTALEIGETLRVYGHTVPSSTVTVFFFYSTITETTLSLEDGSWEVLVDTSKLEARTHLLYAKTSVETGHLSPNSEALLFVVTALPTDDPDDPTKPTATVTPDDDITVTVTETAEEEEPVVCNLPTFLKVFDFNNDCFIDLVEFTTAIKTWFAVWTREGDECDINKDGRCDLRDFSILLYYTYR
jgi:hypothetical protein